MEGVYAVIIEMAAQFPDIAGIGVTSFGETFVMTDENGNPLASAMLYTDLRGAEECAYLVERIGKKHIAEITGVTPHEMYGLPKMMWRKRYDAEVYAKTRHIFQMEDYVVFSLTGNSQIDYSLATRSMVFDIHTLDWSDEILSAAGIDRALLSKPVPTGTDAEKELSDTVNAALQQVEVKKYDTMLIAKGVPKEKIRKYGFVFCGKQVLIGK